jgi:hypothetical protein
MGFQRLAHGERKDAETHMKQALKVLEAEDSRQQLASAYARMSAFYEQRHDAVQALEYLRKAWHTAGHDRFWRTLIGCESIWAVWGWEEQYSERSVERQTTGEDACRRPLLTSVRP